MADVRGLKTSHDQHQVLKEIAQALGYNGIFGIEGEKDGYNHACMFHPREVLERIYGLK